MQFFQKACNYSQLPREGSDGLSSSDHRGSGHDFHLGVLDRRSSVHLGRAIPTGTEARSPPVDSREAFLNAPGPTSGIYGLFSAEGVWNR